MGGSKNSNDSSAQLAIAQQQLELQKQQLTEPEKKVDSMKQAKTDALKEQELRRGLAAAFSRGGMGSKTATGATATSGSAGKLGD